jgi:HK97 family phage major capsid protein
LSVNATDDHFIYIRKEIQMSFYESQEEARANLIMQVRETIDTAEQRGGLDADSMTKIDALEADIEKIDRSLEVAKRQAEREAAAVDAARDFAPITEARGEHDVLRALANGDIRSASFQQETRNTLVPSANTVPVGFADQVFALARLVGPMLNTSQIFTRASGESFRIPTLTAYGAPAITAAGSTIADTEPTFSSILLSPFKVSGLVPIANELIADSGFDIQSVIAEAMGNSIGFSVNGFLTTGTGTVQPTGIVNAAGTGVASTATVLRADDLIDLAHSIDGMARSLPGVGFQVNTTTLGAIRKLKDDDGQYILDVVAGGPSTILGFPVFENPAMASIGSGNKSVIFGYLEDYKVVTTGLDVAVSSDAQFEKDVTVFRYTTRVDGQLAHDSHVKFLTTS